MLEALYWLKYFLGLGANECLCGACVDQESQWWIIDLSKVKLSLNMKVNPYFSVPDLDTL